VTSSVEAQRAVDRLAAAANLSVLVEDVRQRPMWWSTRGAVDPSRASTILDRRVDPLAAEVIPRFGIREAEGPVRTPDLPDRGMLARWCMPARHQGRLMGYVWVLDPDDALGRAGLLPVLIECAEIAGDALAAVASAELDRRLRRDELIGMLLTRSDPDAAAELARIEHLPHDVAVQVEAPARAGGWRLPGAMSAHVVRRRPRPATSGDPLPLADLKVAADRALAVVRVIAAGATLKAPTWNCLGGWRLVVAAPPELAVSAVHPAVEVLRTQPRDDLLVTARVVLDHGADVAAAAADLHLHRTTLYYRLERIQQLTGVRLLGGGETADLHLALWLDAYRRVAD